MEESEVTKENIDLIYQDIASLGVLDEVSQLICIETENILQTQIVPEFWKTFETNLHSESDDQTRERFEFQLFRTTVLQLYKKFQIINRMLERLKYLYEKSGAKLIYNFDETFKSNLLSQLPYNFTKLVYSFYHISFKVFINTKAEEDDDEDMDQLGERDDCDGCEMPTIKCQCQELVTAFGEINLCLTRMGLLDRISGYTLTNLIQDEIYGHIQKTCRGIFDTQHLKNLEKWLDTIVLEWLTRIFNNGSSKLDPGNLKIRESISYFQMKLKYFLYEKYAKTIIDQFFNIIIEFPDSQPAIDDLKLCMEKLDLRAHLVEVLKNSLETRLLHQGVETDRKSVV